MRLKLITTVTFAAAALIAPALAQAAPAGGFTDVDSTFQPGSTITVDTDCESAGGDFFSVLLQNGQTLVSFYADYNTSTLTITIPGDVPVGTGLTLTARCSDYTSQPDNPYVLIKSYGPVYIVVGQGIVAELPTFGRSSTDLMLIAGALVMAGAALVVVPRRRTA